MKKIISYCGLAALLAGAAFCVPSCDCDDPTGPEPYDGPWKIVPCPEGLGPGALDAVFFLKPDLGYAVGCGASIIKYDGTRWEVNYKYPKRENEGAGFNDVWFNGPDDGWVVGDWGDGKEQKGLIMNYDGVKWKEVENIAGSVWWECIFFLDENNGWVGGYGIARWDGNEWHYETNVGFITDMYFNTPTDGWAVSKYNESIYHYDGATWKKVHDDPWGVELTSVFFITPDHGWAGANRGVKSGAQSALLEYKDGKWSYFQLEVRRSGINAINFSSPNCGWAAEQYTYYYDGNKWKYGKDPVTNFITDVFTISETEAWAVGEGRTILHYQP